MLGGRTQARSGQSQALTVAGKDGRSCPPGRTAPRPYLDAHRAVEDADQEHVFHHQPAGHGHGRGAGAEQGARQGVAHVLPAVGHVQLLQLSTDGGHVGLAQPVTMVETEQHRCFKRGITL